MIEGLKVDVKAEELREMLTKRADEVAKKAVLFETKGGEMQSAMANFEDEEGLGLTAGNADPVKSAKRLAQGYRSEERNLRFVAAHLVDGEVYRIDAHIGGYGGLLPALLTLAA